MGIAGINGRITLRGRPAAGYIDSLRRLAAEVAPALEIDVQPAAAPDDMVLLAKSHDVGLALEQGYSRNSGLLLSNKAFTYIAAGLAVAFTDTLGQRALCDDLGIGAIRYSPGDVDALAQHLQHWATNPDRLEASKRAAWQAAQRRWRWDHAEESGRLLDTVARIW